MTALKKSSVCGVVSSAGLDVLKDHSFSVLLSWVPEHPVSRFCMSKSFNYIFLFTFV